MQLIQEAFNQENVLLDLPADDLNNVFASVLSFLSEQGKLRPEDQATIRTALLQREQEVSTAIGHAVAVPHAYMEQIAEPAIVFVRLSRPINLGAPDGIPTRFVFVLLGPKGHSAEHLDSLTTIARLMSDDEFRYAARKSASHADLASALDDFVRRTTPQPEAPPAPDTPEELQFSGRFGGGIIADVKRRLRCYKQDFVDGMNPKTLSATIFLFFACLAPAVTFGGIMGDATGGQIGAVEMLVASAVCGVIYALIGGQPLIILGGIGPLLVFTQILYDLCGAEHFLSAYLWVGLWTAGFLIVMAFTEASCLMRFFTRFTDDIFAALMSLIFIIQAVHAIYLIFERDFADPTKHDIPLLSLILALGTFQVAIMLSQFRRSRYLSSSLRLFLSDFGPTISMASMAIVAILARDYVQLDTLDAPDTVRPTFPAAESGLPPRDWLIDPFAAPMWMRFAAILPAGLAAVLVYLSQNITVRLVNSPENKLHKGAAYHYDLLVVGLMIAGCSLFGLPWLVAATVRSLAHVRALADTEDKVLSSGDTQEQIIHVCETRVSGLLIHILIGLSLLALPLLQLTPKAVLYGLFLYMGVVSIRGNQFFERLCLLLMVKDLYPQTHYIRRTPVNVIHKFTLIQLAALVTLWFINLMPKVGICFPLLIALLVPLRFLLNRFFSEEDLAVLDAREQPAEESNDWAV